MRKKKDIKNQILKVTIVILFCMLICQALFYKKESIVKKKNYTIYVETGLNTGVYERLDSNIFPINTYYLNEDKTNDECVNAVVSQNLDRSVNFETSFTSYCDLYYDVENVIDRAKETLNILNELNSDIEETNGTPDFGYNSDGYLDENTYDSSKESNGIYKSRDDYGPTYYWRGNTQNYGFVKFANKLWYIIRINGDGSLRMIYLASYDNSGDIDFSTIGIGESYFNETIIDYNNMTIKGLDNGYVGYMYGSFSNLHCPTGEIGSCTGGSSSYEEAHANILDSTVKTFIDEWYEDNLENYSDYISDTEFCNDRSIMTTSDANYPLFLNLYNMTTSDLQRMGYGLNKTIYYNAVKLGSVLPDFNSLLIDEYEIDDICPQKNDRFTVSDTETGNGALTYPIALITSNELIQSGFNMKYPPSNHLLSNIITLTLSPGTADTDNANFIDNILFNSGNLMLDNLELNVHPVVNLTQETIKEFTGTGSVYDPFKIAEPDDIYNVLHEKNNTITLSQSSPDFTYNPAGQLISNPTNTNSSKISNGLYMIDDDYGASYYFRGDVNNNYLEFANKYWRILRINGDGSLRLFYDGTYPGEGGSIGTSPYNTLNMDNGYVGYMHGNFLPPSDCQIVPGYESILEEDARICFSGGSTSYEMAHSNLVNSTIKTYLDNWYQNNLLQYDNYIADSVFCNNRSTQLDLSSNWLDINSMAGLTPGYSQATTIYDGYYDALSTNILNELNYSCPQKNDRFTKNNSFGNMALTQKIGLISLPESIAAGTINPMYLHYINNLYDDSVFLKKDFLYWTMTPIYYNLGLKDFSLVYESDLQTDSQASVMIIDGMAIVGREGHKNVSETNIHVVPVINLKYSAIKDMTGTGTQADPFIVN